MYVVIRQAHSLEGIGPAEGAVREDRRCPAVVMRVDVHGSRHGCLQIRVERVRRVGRGVRLVHGGLEVRFKGD